MKDIIVISVDCWRHDALSKMPKLSSQLNGFHQSKAVCHSPYTAGVFPTLLASNHAWDVFENGENSDSVETLPEILSEMGYSTAAFVAGNPFLNDWAENFDTFWNGGYYEGEVKTNLLTKSIGYLYRLLLQKQEIPADEVFQKVHKWYREQNSPRFVWMHLMEPHSPYHPGFQRARNIGLVKSYYSNIEYKLNDYPAEDSLSRLAQRGIESLYWECVGSLDDKISKFIENVSEDTTLLMLGDHGEELDHGVYGHARLYDETVLVPLLSQWTLSENEPIGDSLRQLDIGPTIIDSLDGKVPDSWRGEPCTSESRPSYMWSSPNVRDYFYGGVRTEQFKIIRTFTRDMDPVNLEVYNLEDDPDELEDISGSNPCPDLVEDLDEWTTREHDVQFRSGRSQKVQERLDVLGYR